MSDPIRSIRDIADSVNTMSNIKIFNFNGAEVRTVVLPNGEPGFVGKDVAERLGYADTSDAIKRHCKGSVVRLPLPTAGGVQQTRILTEPDVLRLIVSSTLPAAQEFERWVFEEVLPSIRKTGSYATKPVQLSHSYTDAVAGMEVVARMLRLEGSAALGLVRKATEITAPHLLPALPVYAIDAPAGAPAVSSERTLSLTALLAEHRVLMSTRTANLRLQQLGLIEKATRPSSSGQTRSFWSVTEEGQEYGKNVVHPENPRETQPHWFSAKGEELLRVMGVLE